MYVPQNGIEVIVSSCQSQEGGFKLKCSSTTLHFIFLLQTDFTVGEGDAVWNFEYWCQPPACIFFQSAYFVWMMRHIVGRVISSEQRHCLKGTDTDFQQMPFLLVRAVKDDLESVIYSVGQSKNIEHPDQAQWQKWLTSPSQESFLRGQPSASAARAQFSPHL